MTTQYWAGKTVVVTGGTGFIGSHFVEELLAEGARVVCLYRRDEGAVVDSFAAEERLRTVRMDLVDYQTMGDLFADIDDGVDAIVHCAAVSGSIEFRRNHSAQIIDTNIQMVSNVLNCARSFGVDDVILLSSSDIYLWPTTNPIQEDDDYRKQMYYSPDGYYLSKNYAEVLAEAYRNEFGMNAFLPRLTSVYGPRDNFAVDKARVVPSMFAKVLAGEEIEIWGDGSQTRTYMYVKDLVHSILQMAEKKTYHRLNVGTAEIVPVVELAKLVCAALDCPERIRFNHDRASGRRSRTLDVSRLYEIIDFEPRSLRQGLVETVEWYRRHRLPMEVVR